MPALNTNKVSPLSLHNAATTARAAHSNSKPHMLDRGTSRSDVGHRLTCKWQRVASNHPRVESLSALPTRYTMFSVCTGCAAKRQAASWLQCWVNPNPLCSNLCTKTEFVLCKATLKARNGCGRKRSPSILNCPAKESTAKGL
eukprot:1156274-Amphidinium_carterae.1